MELLRLRAQRLTLYLLLCYAASKAVIVAWLRHTAEVLARRRRALPGFSRCQQRAVEQAHSGVQSKAFVARLVSVTVYGRNLAFLLGSLYGNKYDSQAEQYSLSTGRIASSFSRCGRVKAGSCSNWMRRHCRSWPLRI